MLISPASSASLKLDDYVCFSNRQLGLAIVKSPISPSDRLAFIALLRLQGCYQSLFFNTFKKTDAIQSPESHDCPERSDCSLGGR